MVDKKDGVLKIRGRFKRLNAVSKHLAMPFPLRDDILAQLGNAKYFSSIDLKSIYWQVALVVAEREKPAFSGRMGLLQFRVMPFGLANSYGIFQQCLWY